MTKKSTKTFEAFQEEQKREIAHLNQRIEIEKKKEEQICHQIQKSLNEAKAMKRRRDKQRTARLIRKGVAIEAVCSDSQYLTETEFYELAQSVFGNEKLQAKVTELTEGRHEADEAAKRELDERIAMYSDALKGMR